VAGITDQTGSCFDLETRAESDFAFRLEHDVCSLAQLQIVPDPNGLCAIDGSCL